MSPGGFQFLLNMALAPRSAQNQMSSPKLARQVGLSALRAPLPAPAMAGVLSLVTQVNPALFTLPFCDCPRASRSGRQEPRGQRRSWASSLISEPRLGSPLLHVTSSFNQPPCLVRMMEAGSSQPWGRKTKEHKEGLSPWALPSPCNRHGTKGRLPGSTAHKQGWARHPVCTGSRLPGNATQELGT